jgi:predicted dehydrogenase
VRETHRAERADVERLIALRNDLGVFIAEAWMPAHHPQWAKVREIVQGGGIGRLHTVTGVFTYGLNDPANVRNSADLGGGALRDVGVYPIGAFRFATGLEPQVMSAEAEWEDGIDASTWVRRVPEIRGSGSTSRCARPNGRKWCSRAMAAGSWRSGAVQCRGVWSGGPVLRRADGAEEVFRFPTARQYVSQVEAVGATLLDGADYPMPLEMSLGTQRVVDAVFDTLGPAQGRLWRTNGGRCDRAPE